MDRPSLNHTYRLVWSDEKNTFVAVAESAKSRGKGRGGKAARLLATVLLTPALVLAGPIGGNVTSGVATINQGGSVTNINQSTQRAAINWQGFSVQANETVNFNQPNASAVTLNRVIGNERSVIDGALNANGQVFLVNSAGVLFGKGSSVNVGGLVASTRNISDANFNAGNYVFEGSGSGSVVNQGTLTAKDGGYVALLGNSVSNQGVITATKGTVAMGAADKVTLNFNGNSLIGVTVDEGTLNALVENKQAIYADGGTVILTAKAADQLLGSQVNNSGIIRARTIGDLTGHIELNAFGGTTLVDGTLDASAPVAGNGGFIETSGDHVKVADSANILTRSEQGQNGTWLVDPTDFTIAATGGDMTGTFLSSYLNTQGNYEVKSVAGTKDGNGDINVNDAVTWGSGNTLTLTAVRDVNINNAITVNGAGGKLVLTTGRDYNIRTKASYSGTVLDATGKPVPKQDTSGGVYGSVTFNNTANTNGLVINGNTYTLIYSVAQWDALDKDTFLTANAVSGYYAIAADLEAGGKTYTNSPVYFFSGTLAGLGHKINNFTLNNPQFNAGFIADGTRTTNGFVGVVIRDLGMENAVVTNVGVGPTNRAANAGIFVGTATGTLLNVYSTGSISGSQGLIGGLAGRLGNNSVIRSSFSGVDITVTGTVGGTRGGLVGSIAGGTAGGVFNSHSTGGITIVPTTVDGGATGGNLVGSGSGTIADSYATGNFIVNAPADLVAQLPASSFSGIGGLIGTFSGTVTNSFARGNVAGGIYVGGLIGQFTGGMIRNTYATGNVTAIGAHSTDVPDTYAGGLIGGASNQSGQSSVQISDSYATGNVAATTGGGRVAGLIGALGNGASSPATTNTVTNSYATGNVQIASISGLNPLGAGGLIGTAVSTTLTNVHADGNVTGFLSVGGLVGSIALSAINNAYATGTAISLSANPGAAALAGGLVGFLNGTSTSNTFYNAGSNTKAFSTIVNTPATQSTGLNGDQVKDAQFYANGTIGQVLADRAAAAAAAAAEAARVAAAAAAVRQAASQAASSIVTQTFTPTDPAQSTQQVATITPPGRSIDQNIVIAKPRSFSANVRRIEVDGQIYQIEEEGEKENQRK